MKSLKLISIPSLLLLCFDLVGCEKNGVFDEEQTKSTANNAGSTPLDKEPGIVEIDDIDL